MTLTDPEIAREAVRHGADAFNETFFANLGVESDDALPIGSVDFGGLERAAEERGGSLVKLSRVDPSHAVLMITGEGVPIIYTRLSSSGYRGYTASLHKLFYDLNLPGALSKYDVDHVASRTSATRLGLDYVALIATDRMVNQSYASIENQLCDRPDKHGLVRPNLYQIMKINNIPLLKAKNDTGAGLGIMIGELVEQKHIPKKYAMKYYGLGAKVAERIDKRLGNTG